MKEEILYRIFDLQRTILAMKKKEVINCSQRDIEFHEGLLKTNISILFLYFPEEIENYEDLL